MANQVASHLRHFDVVDVSQEGTEWFLADDLQRRPESLKGGLSYVWGCVVNRLSKKASHVCVYIYIACSECFLLRRIKDKVTFLHLDNIVSNC